MNLETMTEDQALELFYDMRRKFGWTGTVVVPQDLRDAFYSIEERQPTDEEMTAMTGSWAYRKMDDWLGHDVHEAITEMVFDAAKGDNK